MTQPTQYATVATMTEQENFSVQQRQLIPSNFVVLTSQVENNIGSAGRFGKPGYERYLFNYQDEYLYFDIKSNLLEQLGLTSSQNCKDTIYISNEVLSRNPERGGITIDNPEDIILVKPGAILEREVQTDLNNQELTDQATNIQTLNERVNTLQEQSAQLEVNQERLTREKNELQNRLNESNNTINNLQTNLINTQNQVNNLTIERNNRPNISLENYNNLVANENDFRNRYLNANTTINNAQVALGIDNLNNLPALPQGENLNSLLGRPSRRQLQDEQLSRQYAEQQLEHIQQELQEKIIELNRADEILTIKNDEISKLNRDKEKLTKYLSKYRINPFFEINFDSWQSADELLDFVKQHGMNRVDWLYLNAYSSHGSEILNKFIETSGSKKKLDIFSAFHRSLDNLAALHVNFSGESFERLFGWEENKELIINFWGGKNHMSDKSPVGSSNFYGNNIFHFYTNKNEIQARYLGSYNIPYSRDDQRPDPNGYFYSYLLKGNS